MRGLQAPMAALAMLLAREPATPVPGAGVRLERLDGQVLVGKLLDGADTGTVRLLTSRGKTTVPLADLLAITFLNGAERARFRCGVVLVDGDRLAGRVDTADGRTLLIRSGLIGRAEIPRRAVRYLLLPGWSRVPRWRARREGILLADGTFLAGPVRWLDARSVAVDSIVLGLVEVERKRVREVALGGPSPTVRSGRARTQVILATGERLSGQILHITPARLLLQHPVLGACRVPAGEVERVRLLGTVRGKRGWVVLSLTKLQPKAVKQVPFFDRISPPQRVPTPLGGPLRIGRRWYEEG